MSSTCDRTCPGDCCEKFYIGSGTPGTDHQAVIDAIRERSLGDAAHEDDAMIAAMLLPNGRSESGDRPLFTCRNFDTDTRLCRVYDQRPMMCRGYPNYPDMDKNSHSPCEHGCSYLVPTEEADGAPREAAV